MFLQVLITTMHETDFRKVRQMNIQTDAILANQGDTPDYQQMTLGEDCRVELITTNTRGTSVNRNLAIAHLAPEAEYVMFSDDDLRLADGYEELIRAEFLRHPEAEAILFALNCVSQVKLSRREAQSFQRATRRRVSSSGVNGCVIRRDVLLRKNLHFNQFYGPGTENYCGEDSIFLQDLLKKHVKLYLSPVVVADIDQGNSTWSEGYSERYFRTAGMLLKEMYPGLAPLLLLRSAYRMHRKKVTDMSFGKIYRLYREGARQ